jgi:hypothetical protein
VRPEGLSQWKVSVTPIGDLTRGLPVFHVCYKFEYSLPLQYFGVFIPAMFIRSRKPHDLYDKTGTRKHLLTLLYDNRDTMLELNVLLNIKKM